MDSSLSLLREILDILVRQHLLLATLVYVVVAYLALRMIGSAMSFRKIILERGQERQQRQLQALFDRNLINELVQECERRLQTEPNNRVALFWSMKASLFQQQHVKARVQLEQLLRVDPPSKGELEAYIQILASNNAMPPLR